MYDVDVGIASPLGKWRRTAWARQLTVDGTDFQDEAHAIVNQERNHVEMDFLN
jgi:endonuclease V-like protein UPF0215 family